MRKCFQSLESALIATVEEKDEGADLNILQELWRGRLLANELQQRRPIDRVPPQRRRAIPQDDAQQPPKPTVG
jgi:hypothetical protein